MFWYNKSEHEYAINIIGLEHQHVLTQQVWTQVCHQQHRSRTPACFNTTALTPVWYQDQWSTTPVCHQHHRSTTAACQHHRPTTVLFTTIDPEHNAVQHPRHACSMPACYQHHRSKTSVPCQHQRSRTKYVITNISLEHQCVLTQQVWTRVCHQHHRSRTPVCFDTTSLNTSMPSTS